MPKTKPVQFLQCGTYYWHLSYLLSNANICLLPGDLLLGCCILTVHYLCPFSMFPFKITLISNEWKPSLRRYWLNNCYPFKNVILKFWTLSLCVGRDLCSINKSDWLIFINLFFFKATMCHIFRMNECHCNIRLLISTLTHLVAINKH